MSIDPKNHPFWKAVTFDPPEPRDRSFLAPIEERLTKLREHKDVLLSHLQKAYERGDRAEPFDTDKSWSAIESLQFLHSGVELGFKEDMSATECKKRYQEIAQILKRARKMIDGAMRSNDFANGLMNAWWEGTTEFAEAAGRFVDLLYIANEFEKVTNGLGALEQAAARAASDVQTATGRPRGFVPAYIRSLADLYRSCTGLKPGAGRGPFARFARAYLAAIGVNIEEDSVVDIIKEVRGRLRRKANKWAPSPFED
jgi:hypothetical protein